MSSFFFIQEAISKDLPLQNSYTRLVSVDEIKLDFFFKFILENKTTEACIYITQKNLGDWANIIGKITKHFSDLRLHVYTQDCLFENFSAFLKSKQLESVCFGTSPTDFAELSLNRPDGKPTKHVFYNNNAFEFKHRNPVGTSATELLILLMPAWNNFFPPYGIAHIAGALDTTDINYDVIDLNNHYYNELIKQPSSEQKYGNIVYWQNKPIYLEDTRHQIQFIFDILKEKITASVKYIGFSLFGPNLYASEDAMRLIRKIRPDIKIFCGGPHATDSIVKSLIAENLIDAAVIGEGEESVLELLSKWKTGQPISEVAGIAVNESGHTKYGPTRMLMDINKLPKPNFSKFPMYRYERRSTLPIYSSRGCVAKCSFCAETIFWKKFRAVNPENIVNMMEDSIKNYGINTFYFNDSLMNGSHKLLEEMCDEIISRGLKVNFEGYSRLDNKLTPQLMQKMAQAGCKLLLFGFESGSQKIVDLMNKKVFVENYENILSTASRAGISCQVCIIVGFPGETWKDFFSTLYKAIKMHPYISSLNLSIMEISHNSLIEKDFARYNIVNSQNRYWRTKYWTNFFLLRLIRFYIFRYSWIFITKKSISLNIWDRGYLMLTKKITSWIKTKLAAAAELKN